MTDTNINPAADAVARWSDPKRRPLFKGRLIDEDGCACAQGDILLHSGYTPEQLRSMGQARADKEVAKLLGISRAHAVLLRLVNEEADGCPQDVLTNPEKILGDQAEIILAFWRHLDRMTTKDWEAAAHASYDAWDAWCSAWKAEWAARDVEDTIRRRIGRLAAGDTIDVAWTAARDAASAAARAALDAWYATGVAWYAAEDASSAAARAARIAARAAAYARDAAWTAARAAQAAARATSEIQGAAILREQGKPFFFLPMFYFASPEEGLAALRKRVSK